MANLRVQDTARERENTKGEINIKVLSTQAAGTAVMQLGTYFQIYSSEKYISPFDVLMMVVETLKFPVGV